MFECRTFITVKEIGEVLGVSESKSYGIVRNLNKELADKGYMVIPGRIFRRAFLWRRKRNRSKGGTTCRRIGIKRQASNIWVCSSL